ncbi:3'-5' exonuclease [Chamaesiphon sp. OTE_75_metabat_556]|uniref:3'-5' exonuclease n=1 Tax=Chamaesiphon sp. OTE_75_metabat_556 TaxID=2964692 RepID=UPI002869FFB3|nr:3'-5' exonuclease [Chamaesiphon sp. OTE_75_metabat_556]
MNDRNEAINWAKSILDSPNDYYILDTETTGLSGPEIIELGIIDLDGNEIINQRFCPKTKVTEGATNIHGMTNISLQDEPLFDSVIDCLNELIFDRKLLVYNLPFDREALFFTFGDRGYDVPPIAGECVMQWYSQFCGEWNTYRSSYRWQKLPGGDHSAIGDCKATLQVIKGMAASPLAMGLMPMESPAA